MKVSRYELIKKLIRKEYKGKKKRPNAIDILGIIRKYDLQLHRSDGKRRSREAMTRAIAKAYNSLQ